MFSENLKPVPSVHGQVRKIGILTVAIASVVAMYSTGAVAMEGRGPQEDCCGAGPMSGGRENRPQDFHLILKKQLNLSGKQAGEISDIMEEDFVKAKPLFENVQNERKKLMLLTIAAKTDLEGIKAQAAKVAEAESVIALNFAHLHKRIAGIMSPSQAVKYGEMNREHIEHHRGHGPGGPPPEVRVDRRRHHACESDEDDE